MKAIGSRCGGWIQLIFVWIPLLFWLMILHSLKELNSTGPELRLHVPDKHQRDVAAANLQCNPRGGAHAFRVGASTPHNIAKSKIPVGHGCPLVRRWRVHAYTVTQRGAAGADGMNLPGLYLARHSTTQQSRVGWHDLGLPLTPWW